MYIISVIIPTYNGEKSISSTIESILNQEMDAVEIITVNDGSTDSTLQICQSYAMQYSNIRVVSQENKGVSAARNLGISKATGKYILFLDSDDYIISGGLSMGVQNILEKEQFDVLMLSSYIANRHRKRFAYDLRLSDKIISGGQIYPIAGCVGSCIYKRKLLMDNHIFYDEGISRNEDQVFKLKALYKAQIVRTMNHFCYVYCSNPNSITHSMGRMIDCVNAWRCAYDWFKENLNEEEQKQVLLYVQIKIQSRLLLYAQNYIQTGHSENELMEELQRIDGLHLLKSIDGSQVMPYQREDLKLFQNDVKKFTSKVRKEGWKITIGRALLRIPPIRMLRDYKKYPLTNVCSE